MALQRKPEPFVGLAQEIRELERRLAHGAITTRRAHRTRAHAHLRPTGRACRRATATYASQRHGMLHTRRGPGGAASGRDRLWKNGAMGYAEVCSRLAPVDRSGHECAERDEQRIQGLRRPSGGTACASRPRWLFASFCVRPCRCRTTQALVALRGEAAHASIAANVSAETDRTAVRTACERIHAKSAHTAPSTVRR
jgi:hypothetical protein